MSAPAVPSVAVEPSSRRWRRALSANKLLCLSLAVLAVIVVAAALGPWCTPYDPRKIDFLHKLRPPSALHPFGTDALGHDLFSQVVAGAWLSLVIAGCVVLLSIAIGGPLGAVAGFAGGVLDMAVMRVCDVFLAFPPLLLPIAISAVLGPSIPNMIVAIALSWFPWYARLVRSSVMRVRSELFVSAARSMGLPEPVILVRHCLLNSLTPVIVQGSMDFGSAILTAASLSFIGVGARPPALEWGLLVSLARTTFLDHWWTAAFPGLAIAVTVLVVSLVGDGVRDLLDPRHGEGA